MLGLLEIRDLSHAMEDVLGVLRDERRPLEPVGRHPVPSGRPATGACPGLWTGSPQSAAQPRTVSIRAELAACTHTQLRENLPAAKRHGCCWWKIPRAVRQVETFLLQDAGYVVDVAQAGQ